MKTQKVAIGIHHVRYLTHVGIKSVDVHCFTRKILKCKTCTCLSIFYVWEVAFALLLETGDTKILGDHKSEVNISHFANTFISLLYAEHIYIPTVC